MAYFVYRIIIDETTRYIGQTNNIERRTKEHNRMCFKNLNKKTLYEKIRTTTDYKIIELILIKKFTTKTEAKRYEALLILQDHFSEKKLWQKVPSISDR